MSDRTVKAKKDTWLKKSWQSQASDLADNEKVFVKQGKVYQGGLLEFEHDPSNDQLQVSGSFSEQHGHFQLDMSVNGAGIWFLYGEHWEFADTDIIAPKGGYALPSKWEDINWSAMSNPVSRYFTVGEVALNQTARIPTEDAVKANIFKMAQRMDEIREWWGHPLGINSWYRPWHINRAVGSRAPNHPEGTGVDFRPLAGGSVQDMQRRFEQEWFNAGKWQGGFGRGARKGFVHLDLRGIRKWNY